MPLNQNCHSESGGEIETASHLLRDCFTVNLPANQHGQVDICHVTHYYLNMIKSFADKHTETLFLDGTSKKLPSDVRARALRKLDRIDTAYRIEDLRMPPGNRLHVLEGDRKGQWAISINDRWRICFRFEGENAYNVEICGYH